MEKLRLLIAEGTEEFGMALAEIFRGRYQVRLCTDGNEARRLMRQFQPDILVLDLMLPGYDGISLLQWAAGENLHPVVLATSFLANGYVTDAVTRLGVGYLLRKPCDLGAAAARVEDMQKLLGTVRLTCQDRNARISDMLHMLGIPTKLRGYIYLREAVILMAEDPTQPITKQLYPEVARRCGCAAMHVERSIRSAILSAWTRRDENIWRLYFYPDVTGSIPRPTNGEMITRLADCIRNQGEVFAGPADGIPVQAMRRNG